MRCFARVEYDGADFCGWQIQNGRNDRTVQAEIEKAFSIVLGVPTEIVGAGRTDAGVHGRNQGLHVDIPEGVDLGRLEYSVSSLLPFDVAIRGLQPVSNDFHARFSAIERHYSYSITFHKSPLMRHYAMRLKWKIDLDRFRENAAMLIGAHDFTTFCATRCGTEDMNCNVSESLLVVHDAGMVYTIKANRFVYRMVRSITGTLLDIARGAIDENIGVLLAAKDRSRAGQTAPACGLVLENVRYREVD